MPHRLTTTHHHLIGDAARQVPLTGTRSATPADGRMSSDDRDISGVTTAKGAPLSYIDFDLDMEFVPRDGDGFLGLVKARASCRIAGDHGGPTRFSLDLRPHREVLRALEVTAADV